MDVVRRAMQAFDARAFAKKHGGYKESQSGHTYEYLLPCPQCGSSRLRWNHPAKQTWTCWGCHIRGDTLDLVGLMEKCSRDRALELVEEGYHGGDANVQLDDLSLPSIASQLEVMRWPHGVVALGPQHTIAWNYLTTRGVTPEMAAPWHLAWGTAGWLRNYVVFPCWWRGQLAYWQGRIARELGPDERRLKSRNPTSRGQGWSAQSVIMQGPLAAAAPHVVVVEGPIDALKVGPHACALLGKAFTASKLSWLVGLGAGAYTVYLDSDAKAQAKGLEVARKLAAFRPTFVACPPPDCDPGNLTPAQNAVCLSQARQVSPQQLQ